jgi:hypothetical protein
MEIVTLTMSVFIGNLKPLAGQNENCCTIMVEGKRLKDIADLPLDLAI